MPLPPPLLSVAYANTSRLSFSDTEVWSITTPPYPIVGHLRKIAPMYT